MTTISVVMYIFCNSFLNTARSRVHEDTNQNILRLDAFAKATLCTTLRRKRLKFMLKMQFGGTTATFYGIGSAEVEADMCSPLENNCFTIRQEADKYSNSVPALSFWSAPIQTCPATTPRQSQYREYSHSESIFMAPGEISVWKIRSCQQQLGCRSLTPRQQGCNIKQDRPVHPRAKGGLQQYSVCDNATEEPGNVVA